MAIYKVTDKKTIAPLFENWDEICIWSCLQDCMGIAYADDLKDPKSAQIFLGGFCYLAGEANNELLQNKPDGYQSKSLNLVPQHQQWEEAIEYIFGQKATRCIRYATKKEAGVFDEQHLQKIVSQLSPEYELKLIDEELYEKTKKCTWSQYTCGNYSCYEDYQKNGIGIAVLKNNEIVSAASSYAFYRDGIEIEIDTRKDERGQGLASICGAQLILECLKRNLYPSWDALSKTSLFIAQKLGYTFAREYISYEIVDF